MNIYFVLQNNRNNPFIHLHGDTAHYFEKMVRVIGIQNYFLLAEPKPVNLTIYFRVFVACNLS